MPLAKLPPNRLRPDHHQILIDALETARKKVCGYGPLARTCDCKFGLVPYALMGTNTARCSHRSCEHTGCPEIRQLMAQVKNAQRETWARRSDAHGRLVHGWLCCRWHPDLDPNAPDFTVMYDGNPAGATCGGVGHCFTCTPEADQLHGLLPPPEVADDYDQPSADTMWNDPDNNADAQQAGGL